MDTSDDNYVPQGNSWKNLIRKLDRYVQEKERVVLQVKDLEPTVGSRHVTEPDKYIMGTLNKYYNTYGFREDGKESSQEVLKERLYKIKTLELYEAEKQNRNPEILKALENQRVASLAANPYSGQNKAGGRRRTRKTRRVKRKGTKAKKSRKSRR
jgi:hypothetical protein